MSTNTESIIQRKRQKLLAFLLLLFITIISISLSAIAGILYYNFGIDSTTIYNYAKVLGVISAILMIFQWSPQIYITWKMKVYIHILF